MTPAEAEKALAEARKTRNMRTVLSPAYWDALKRHVWEARTTRGEGLIGTWTSLAGDVAELVAYGVLNKSNWRSYFQARCAEMQDSGDPETRHHSRDQDQIRTCLDGLTRLVAAIS